MGQNFKVLRSELETLLTSEIKSYPLAAIECKSNEGNWVEHYCNALIGACCFVTPSSCLIEIPSDVYLQL